MFTVDLFGLQPTQGSCTWGSQALFFALCLLVREGGCLDRPRGGGSRWAKEETARTQTHREAEHPQHRSSLTCS